MSTVRIGDLDLGEFPLLLAPMEDVSDPPFRAVCKANGADLMYTEFISSEGLIRDARKSVQKLDIYDDERPMGIQIFGGELEPMVQAIDKVAEAKPNLIDINYGCPVKQVVCKEAGSGMLRNLPKLLKITEAMVKRSPLPVTVKRVWVGMKIASKWFIWPKRCKTLGYRPLPFMAVPGCRCTKARPIGPSLAK